MFANYQRMQPTKLFLGNFLGNSLFNLSWKLKESQPMYVIPFPIALQGPQPDVFPRLVVELS